MAEENEAEDDWTEWWNARMEAMEQVLGESDDLVLHAVIPFQLGAEMGGAADVVRFSKHLEGVVYATSELIGCDDQVQNELGIYELMICHRREDEEGGEWGAELISRLAHYTCEAELNPGDTMDIGPATPEGSSIAALLFCEHGRFTVRGRAAGLLLAMGITAEELDCCGEGKQELVEEKLKAAGVYPFTELFRESVV